MCEQNRNIDSSYMAYAELVAASNFSFLRGASHPEELAEAAAALGLKAFAVTDRNSVAGVVRAHQAAKDHGVRFVPGTRLAFADETPDIALWPMDRPAWGRLCRLLSLGKRRADKGDCRLGLDDLLAFSERSHLAVLPPERLDADGLRRLGATLRRLAAETPGRVRLAVAWRQDGADRRRLARLVRLARDARVPVMAVGDVLYHHPDRRSLQDVLTCIREHTTLAEAGRRLERNAERHLKAEETMRRLFRDLPEAVDESGRLLADLAFSLDELRYEYPDEPTEGHPSPQAALEALTLEGAARRYPAGIPEKVKAAVEHEFAIIRQLGYAPYFLTVHDIVRFARSRGILCQGRGSAANSAVCFCLGVTEVDPERGDLLFERFISPERREPPDIDVDFEHERREEVIQYIYGKYGRERAGLAATVISYRARSAIREVGKAFGLSADTVGALAGQIWGWSSASVRPEDARRAGVDPADRSVMDVVRHARALAGFPRHLSQHVGGFVITRGRLDEVVPIENAAMEDRTVIEWDKDDLDLLGILKIDVLALGMLSCVRKAFGMLARHYGRPLTIATIPPEDPAVYDMLCRADSVGVFQVESRAQMTMLPRLRPRTFYDLVIEVAIVRPGPIQGDMVHPYLRRRQGLEPVTFPKPELEAVLGKTMGVPLFQEQAMRIAIVAAGFTPSEADKLRRAMATFRKVGTIGTFQAKMIDGMAERGYDRDFAERCFRQIEGFGEYGFPESHAASFALLVYASSWLKCHYPDVFCAALLNAQPMGFYAPAQIVRDAEDHGVEVRPVDVNRSDYDNTLEHGPHAADRLVPRHRTMRPVVWSSHAVRLGLRQIKGVREDDMRLLVERRGAGYDSVRDVWLRTGLARAVVERLADADAFRSIGLDRRAALWAARGLGRTGDEETLPLFLAAAGEGPKREPDVHLPPMPLGEHVVNDYRFLSLSLKAHPVTFVRAELARLGVAPSEALAVLAPGRTVTVAGLVLVRQRPGSARGVIFMTVEDETGVANLIVWPKVFEAFRGVVIGARFVRATGRLQRDAGVIHLVVERIVDETPRLVRLTGDLDGVDALARADEVKRPVAEGRDDKPRPRLVHMLKETPEIADDLKRAATGTARVMPKGRNFQ
ncbi:error-prone DNA polymerase [Chthonobacter rhizosphaerae]|uniref:error-prone DNA polymerase n=1 Tax=Chthonobacter rhizosphaerae TaxID=2735553 RepID=UPI001FE57E9B|nr:error-prone DNA polymerase [Chthonobacter rhizosphaerae]